MRRVSGFVCGAVGLMLLTVGCNWAPLTEGGEQIQFLNQKAVESCQQIGTTNARTKPTILGLDRDAATIREELRSLARNDAAKMGGTAVSPLGSVENGEQSFGIYVCGGDGG